MPRLEEEGVFVVVYVGIRNVYFTENPPSLPTQIYLYIFDANFAKKKRQRKCIRWSCLLIGKNYEFAKRKHRKEKAGNRKTAHVRAK